MEQTHFDIQARIEAARKQRSLALGELIALGWENGKQFLCGLARSRGARKVPQWILRAP